MERAGRAKVPTSEEAARRWLQRRVDAHERALALLELRVGAIERDRPAADKRQPAHQLAELRSWVAELGVLLVHVHEDVRALREQAGLYSPECYEPAAADDAAGADDPAAGERS